MFMFTEKERAQVDRSYESIQKAEDAVNVAIANVAKVLQKHARLCANLSMKYKIPYDEIV